MKAMSDALWFRLCAVGDARGISCDATGAFVGGIPLLSSWTDDSGREVWAPRPLSALNADLTAGYGLPINVAAKSPGLGIIARALNAGSVALAQIATLHLQLPDPPPLAKGGQSPEENIALAALLYRSGILDVEAALSKLPSGFGRRDVSDQPRVPQGRPGGGQWTVEGSDEALPPVPPVRVAEGLAVTMNDASTSAHETPDPSRQQERLDQIAKDTLSKYLPQSRAQGQVIFGLIYQDDASGAYHASDTAAARIFTQEDYNSLFGNLFHGNHDISVAAIFLTHFNDIFTDPLETETFTYKEINAARRDGIQLYGATPSGRIIYYNGNTNESGTRGSVRREQ